MSHPERPPGIDAEMVRYYAARAGEYPFAPQDLRAVFSEYPRDIQEDFSDTVHISHQLLPLLPGLRREQTAGRLPP